MNEYIGTLLQSRTQTHIFHLQTKSYAKHVALQAYYEEIIPIIDEIAEGFQGSYGIIEDISMKASIKNLTDDNDTIEYIQNLKKFCELKRQKLPQDKFLQNLYDNVDTLINTTLYKLKFLS
jgi:DNA-binding ferritin-like protein